MQLQNAGWLYYFYPWTGTDWFYALKETFFTQLLV